MGFRSRRAVAIRRRRYQVGSTFRPHVAKAPFYPFGNAVVDFRDQAHFVPSPAAARHPFGLRTRVYRALPPISGVTKLLRHTEKVDERPLPWWAMATLFASGRRDHAGQDPKHPRLADMKPLSIVPLPLTLFSRPSFPT